MAHIPCDPPSAQFPSPLKDPYWPLGSRMMTEIESYCPLDNEPIVIFESTIIFWCLLDWIGLRDLGRAATTCWAWHLDVDGARWQDLLCRYECTPMIDIPTPYPISEAATPPLPPLPRPIFPPGAPITSVGPLFAPDGRLPPHLSYGPLIRTPVPGPLPSTMLRMMDLPPLPATIVQPSSSSSASAMVTVHQPAPKAAVPLRPLRARVNVPVSTTQTPLMLPLTTKAVLPTPPESLGVAMPVRPRGSVAQSVRAKSAPIAPPMMPSTPGFFVWRYLVSPPRPISTLQAQRATGGHTGLGVWEEEDSD